LYLAIVFHYFLQMSVHIFSLSLQIAFSCMGPFGFAVTFLNTPVEEFKVYLNASYNYNLTVDEYKLLWNVIQNIWLIGFLLGMFLSPIISDRLGRKVGLISGNICNLLMAILQWAAIYFYLPSLLLVGRFISSIVSAIAFQSIVLYLQEFPPSSKRGISSYTSDIALSFFCFIGMTLGTNEILGDHLSILMGVQIVLCAISVLLTARLPESPKFLLLKKNDEAAALASTHFFHGEKSRSVDKFMRELKEEIKGDASSAHSLRDIVTIFAEPALRKTMFLGLAAVEMTVPLWTLLFNSTDLLLDLNASKFVSQWTSSAMVICYFIGTLLGAFLIDRIGRRSLLIPCSAISMFCIGAVTCAFYLKPIFHQSEYIAVAALLMNGLVFGLGIGSIGWFIAPELSPQRYRSLIQSIVAIINTVQSAIFTFSVMPLYLLRVPSE
ncbi:hypothetical protein PMAYCL1PPCAC_32074, partial [Pristionchus mayeri]